MAAANKDLPRVAQNKKAYHDYFVLETYEAGIALYGTEVKSIRKGRVNLKDSWCNIVNGEIFANGMHISPYDFGNRENPDPLRTRKLLAHRHEIARLARKMDEKGLTLVPLRLYFKDGRAKVEIGVAKGKQLHDKRDSLREREARREMERARSERY